MARSNPLFPLILCLAAIASAQLNTPNIGLARYSDGTVRSVFGLHANFVVSTQAAEQADAISFSDTAGLIAKDGQIRLFGPGLKLISEYDSGENAPLLNVDGDLSSAIAWLPAHHALLHWSGKAFILTDVVASDLPGQVTSVRVRTPDTAALLIRESDESVSEATVSLISGDLVSLSLVPGVMGGAFYQNSFYVFHDRGELKVTSRQGPARTFPLVAGDLSFERMSSDWLHLSSASTGRNWILHLTNSAMELSELPAPHPVARPITKTAGGAQQ